MKMSLKDTKREQGLRVISIVSIGIYCPTRRVVQQLVEVIRIPEFAKIFDCGIMNL